MLRRMLSPAAMPQDGYTKGETGAVGNLAPRRRVAIGVFDSLGGLQLSIDGLLHVGVEPSRIMVVAGQPNDRTSLANLMLRYGARLLMLGIGLRDSTWSAQRTGLEATSILVGSEEMNQPFEAWGSSDSIQALKALLNAGACALVALVDNPEIERRVLEILLINSIAPVQQHDLIGVVKP